jgi:hypothetical protein
MGKSILKKVMESVIIIYILFYFNDKLSLGSKSLVYLHTNVFNILWKHLDKFEMNVMKVQHPARIRKFVILTK